MAHAKLCPIIFGALLSLIYMVWGWQQKPCSTIALNNKKITTEDKNEKK
jgi:hypothetical protein